MSRPALRLVVNHEPSGASPAAPVADDALPPTSSAIDAQGRRTSPVQPCAFNYYLPFSEIFHFGDVVCLAAILATTIYFAAHIEQAIALGVGPWAVFGGGSSL